MATKASQQVNEDGNQSTTCKNGEDSLTEFLSMLRPFCEGEKGRNLRTIIERNKHLEKEIIDLRTTQRVNLNAMKDQEADRNRIQATLEGNLKTEKKRVVEALREAEDANKLRAEILENEKQIQGLIKAKKNLESTHGSEVAKKEELQDRVQKIGEEKKALLDKLKKQKDEHDTTIKNLNNVKESLSTIRKFLVPLKDLNEIRKSTMFVVSLEQNSRRKIG